MELGPQKPRMVWFLGPNSILAIYMDPLGYYVQIVAILLRPELVEMGFASLP